MCMLERSQWSKISALRACWISLPNGFKRLQSESGSDGLLRDYGGGGRGPSMKRPKRLECGVKVG